MSVMYPEVHRVSHRLTAALVAERSGKGEWVLDMGSGDGDLARLLRERQLRPVAADPSPAPGGLGATWEHLPFRPESLAAATACASLHYAADPAAALARCAECLRPGGRVVVALSPVHPTDRGARSGERTARRRTGNPDYKHFSRGQVQAMFQGAGLLLTERPFRIPGPVGTKRRIKGALGVDLAQFPTLVGDKPLG